MGFIRNRLLGIDSRKKNRTPICVLVEEPGKTQEFFDKSIDLSEEGIFIQTTDPHRKGDEVTLRFALPGSPVLTVSGEVTRVEPPKRFTFSPKPPAPGMAIRFTSLDQESKRIISKFVNS